MDQGRRVGVAVLLLAGTGLLVWAGVDNYKSRQTAMQQARDSQVKLVGDNGSTATITTTESPLGKDLRGKAAPEFTLDSVESGKVSSAKYKGHPMVVNFWATYCGPCKLEMPWFEEFSHKYAAQGLQVIGIDDEDGVTKDDVKSAAKKAGVTYPIAMDSRETASAYGLGDYLPQTYYIDSNGVVQEETPGAPSKDEVEANIRKILPAGGM